MPEANGAIAHIMENFWTRDNPAHQTVRRDNRMKTVSDRQVFRKSTYFAPVLRKYLEEVLQQIRKKTRKEEEMKSRKQWTSPRMSHSRVTVVPAGCLALE